MNKKKKRKYLVKIIESLLYLSLIDKLLIKISIKQFGGIFVPKGHKKKKNADGNGKQIGTMFKLNRLWYIH